MQRDIDLGVIYPLGCCNNKSDLFNQTLGTGWTTPKLWLLEDEYERIEGRLRVEEVV